MTATTPAVDQIIALVVDLRLEHARRHREAAKMQARLDAITADLNDVALGMLTPLNVHQVAVLAAIRAMEATFETSNATDLEDIANELYATVARTPELQFINLPTRPTTL